MFPPSLCLCYLYDVCLFAAWWETYENWAWDEEKAHCTSSPDDSSALPQINVFVLNETQSWYKCSTGGASVMTWHSSWMWCTELYYYHYTVYFLDSILFSSVHVWSLCNLSFLRHKCKALWTDSGSVPIHCAALSTWGHVYAGKQVLHRKNTKPALDVSLF